MPGASSYIRDLASRGRHHFTTNDAVSALGGSVNAVRAALRRLKAKGDIADPHRGFHVIVPPEYRRLGCLPAEQFVPQLMQHLGEPYYMALLSAAELHGAAHHGPQATQVMVQTNRRTITCGSIRIEFVARKDSAQTSVVEINTARGPLRVASPEATALELVGYADRCGGLDNVATLVDELAPVLNASRLVTEATRSPIAWAQRLGYLLDLTHHRDLADRLVSHVEERAEVVAPLVRAVSQRGAVRDLRWKLAVNADVESEA